MKKLYFFFIASIFLAMTASASPMRSNMGDVKDVPIQREETQGENNRPQAPALRLFSAFVDTDSNALFVSSRYDVGEVSATIENTTAGDIYSYTFDSADTALLPISCTGGLWSITLTLESGTKYVGEFYL